MIRTLHVVRHGDRWAVTKTAGDRPLSQHRTQADAERAAHEFALALGLSDVLVEGDVVTRWPHTTPRFNSMAGSEV